MSVDIFDICRNFAKVSQIDAAEVFIERFASMLFSLLIMIYLISEGGGVKVNNLIQTLYINHLSKTNFTIFKEKFRILVCDHQLSKLCQLEEVHVFTFRYAFMVSKPWRRLITFKSILFLSAHRIVNLVRYPFHKLKFLRYF